MPSSFKDIFLLSKGSGVKPFSPSLAWIVQWRMNTDTHTPWTSHTSQNEPCHSPQDCFLSCWDMRFLNQILLGMKMPPQCSIILEKWQHVRQQMSNLIEMWPHHCQHFCLSLADHNQRKTEHYHVSDSMLIVSGCVLPFIASVNVPFLSVLSGYFCLICPSFLISFPLSPLSLHSSFHLFWCLSIIFCLPPSCCRRLTSVSWDRQRLRMPTVFSADRWGQFTCLERRSVLLRSWLSISWVRATRFEGLKWSLMRCLCHIKRQTTTKDKFCAGLEFSLLAVILQLTVNDSHSIYLVSHWYYSFF